MDLVRRDLVRMREMRKELEGYEMETGLFYRAPLGRDLTFSKEQARGRMQEKSRVSRSLCSNSTGSYNLDPILIGTSKTMQLLCHNSLKESAWMDSKIFSSWFRDVFVPQFKRRIGKKDRACSIISLG